MSPRLKRRAGGVWAEKAPHGAKVRVSGVWQPLAAVGDLINIRYRFYSGFYNVTASLNFDPGSSYGVLVNGADDIAAGGFRFEKIDQGGGVWRVRYVASSIPDVSFTITGNGHSATDTSPELHQADDGSSAYPPAPGL